MDSPQTQSKSQSLKKNIARLANAVQVASLYPEDKIDKKNLSTG